MIYLRISLEEEQEFQNQERFECPNCNSALPAGVWNKETNTIYPNNKVTLPKYLNHSEETCFCCPICESRPESTSITKLKC